MNCANSGLFLVYTDNRNGNPDVYGECYIPPIASFVATPPSSNAPLTVVFTNTSTAPSRLTAWAWSFGDGYTSTQQNPMRVYQRMGVYTVRLTTGTGTYTDTETKLGFVNVIPPNPLVVTYTCDGPYRLTRAGYSTGGSLEYEYDAVGNRLAYTQTFGLPVVTRYTYDAANRLTSVDGQAYTWDNNGNLTNDGSKTYLYNQANRLITVTATGLTWSATYNDDGARLTQVANGTPTTYSVDLAAPLVTVLAQQDASRITQYIYGDGDSPLASHDGTTWTYLSGRDGLNSVRQETDANGNVLTARGFDPYGVPLDGNGGAPFGYTGEQTDVTGLIFLRARYMQPALGVFLSRDPWSGSAFSPGTMNGWNYTEGNPLNRLDPSGWQASCPGGTCGPDVTQWLMEEMEAHYNYGRDIRSLRQTMKSQAFALIGSPDPTLVLNDVARETPFKEIASRLLSDKLKIGNYPLRNRKETEMVLGVLGMLEFGAYGLAVDYSNLQYQSTDIWCATEGCEVVGNKQHRTATLCDHCIDVSDMGNMMFGLGGIARGYLWSDTYIFAGMYNVMAGEPGSNVFQAFFSPDGRGAIVGWRIGSLQAYANRDVFCQLINNWRAIGYNENASQLQNCGACKTPTSETHQPPSSLKRRSGSTDGGDTIDELRDRAKFNRLP